MLDHHLPKYLPSAEELPNSDETPVDNDLQELIPALLKSILLMIWEWILILCSLIGYRSSNLWKLL